MRPPDKPLFVTVTLLPHNATRCSAVGFGVFAEIRTPAQRLLEARSHHTWTAVMWGERVLRSG
jgi:hypothetical protein